MAEHREVGGPVRAGSRAKPALVAALLAGVFAAPAHAQTPVPPERDARIFELVDAVSAARIERDVRTLVAFGTRHTLSDTLSPTRGIGAARRWIKAEFDSISAACGGCLEVSYQRALIAGEDRIPDSTWVVSMVAVLRGTAEPDRYVIMTGDIDSRVSDVMNAADSSPGANDNASGIAGVLEAARVIAGSGHRFPASIVFAGLSGEEQGLYGGKRMAEIAREEGWRIEAVFNNDMIGNIEGVDGVTDDTTARVFSESPPAGTTEEDLRRMRFFGGEVDGPSRQLARYVDRIADGYLRNLDVRMIYRLDRFGRGGHHRPFNDAGFPAVRIMETHENYTRQHQDVRVEDGIAYGDVIEGVDFDYAAKLTALNVATLASLAWAPTPPDSVTVAGAVEPAARLSWSPVPGASGYKVYWRETTSPTWDRWTWAGDATETTMTGLVVDNFFFGVAAVSAEGSESVVSFPRPFR
ncbi:MAG TPA: M28 family metallopeptidase [Gemmatimonadota bacterium]|nr:M28 family metallopeptidase [Gemmatimonadota bacterium]